MTRSTKWLIGLVVVGALGAVVAHGVPVPKFVWEPALAKLQTKYPDHEIAVTRVVAGISHRPHLMVSGVKVNYPKQSESLDLALLRLEVNGWKSLKEGQLVIDSLAVKGLEAERATRWNCNDRGLRCLPLMPAGFAVAADSQLSKLPGKPVLDITNLELSKWHLHTTDPDGATALDFNLDRFEFIARSGKEDKFALGIRMQQPVKPGEKEGNTNAMTFAATATPQMTEANQITLVGLNADVSGDWQSFPWTGSVAVDALKLTPPPLAEASQERSSTNLAHTLWQFSGSGLRSYVKRDDNPEIHQAAFSSLNFEGGLPMQPLTFRKAEWTFTHEKAKAWTFDMTLIPALGMMEIKPAVIEGSEGEPAEPQARLLNCKTDGPSLFGLIGSTAKLQPTEIREDKPYWAWKGGWFHTVDSYPKQDADLVLCPLGENS